MKTRLRLCTLTLVATLLVNLGWTHAAAAVNAVFLSNDTADSEVTYVVQVRSLVARHFSKIRIVLPAGADAAHAVLGRITLGLASPFGSVLLSGPDTLLVDLGGIYNAASTPIRVELFNLKNPPAGDHEIHVSILDRMNHVLEAFPSIVYTTYDGGTGSGDITAVIAGPGLTGGAETGEVTLSVNTSVIQQRVTGVCGSGNAIRVINQDGTVTCASVAGTGGGTVTSIATGAGLTGGPITTTGTVAVPPGGITTPLLADGGVITPKLSDGAVTGAKLAANSVDSSKIVDGSIGAADINAAQVQVRVSGTCTTGNAIRLVNQDGTVSCQSVGSGGGGVASVTASAPLHSSGGTTPDISLPNVTIGVNTAIGLNALFHNTTGTDNTASGTGALATNTEGFGNTATGSGALSQNTRGSNNTAQGQGALGANTIGSNNTAIGVLALQANTGSSNTAVGSIALQVNQGSGNTAVGANALSVNGTGKENTAVGLNALAGNQDGYSNTALGNRALQQNTSGVNNTAVGSFALTQNTSTIVSTGSGFVVVAGSANTALGASALFLNTTGSSNTASGFGSLSNNTTGDDNTASGALALAENTTGSRNTAGGLQALANNETGSDNTAGGADALGKNVSGNGNTAQGSRALTANTDGFLNTAAGYQALQNNTSGFGNAALGAAALVNNTTGLWNTAVGTGAGVATGSLFNATAIGSGAIADNSNQVVLGDGGVLLVKTHGDLRVGEGTTVGCVANGTGSAVIAGTCQSDRRLKKDIRPFAPALERLVQLHPVHFRWKTGEYPELQLGSGDSYGLIAQDVEAVLPEMVTEGRGGYKAVHYSMLPLLLLQAIREQQSLITQQRTENAELRARIEALERALPVTSASWR